MSILHRFGRRDFLKVSSVAAASLLAPASGLRGQLGDDKLRLAVIGCGGRGADNLEELAGEHVAVLCDVNRTTLAKAAAAHPGAHTEVDFRKVFDHAGEFDAVVVSTLRAHARLRHAAGAAAGEARLLREAADAQHLGGARHPRGGGEGQGRHADGHADPRRRQLPPRRRAGPGRRDRPGARVPRLGRRAPGAGRREEEAKAADDIVFVQRASRRGRADARTGSTGISGSAPRPRGRSTTSTFPGPKWYRWWDFGNGTMSDLGSHWNDLPFWALKLHAPSTIEASGPPPHPEIAPASMQGAYEYGARATSPP